MALQVWLPLNGDIHNQGLNNINIIDNNATINNNGKIGKCYSFNGSDQSITYNGYTNFGNTFTLSFWVYINTAATGFIFCNRTAAYGGVEIYSSSNKLTIDACGASYGASTRWNTSTTLSINTWYHISIVRNPQKILYYVDGNLKETKNLAYADSYADIVCIGCRNENGNNKASYFNGKLNDFRIYNHCLSPKEVHEIAKGLVLHYKLDNSGLGNVNLLSPSVLDSSPAWKSALQGTEVYKGKEAVLIRTDILYSKTSSGSTSVFPTISFKSNTQYTLSITWCDHLRTNSYSSSLYFRFKYDDGTLSSNIISPAANNNADWKHVSVTSAADKTVTMICTTYGRAGNVSIADIKLEEGNMDTGFSNTTDDDNSKIYDSSGYCNDGTIVGTTTLNLSSPRYDKCLSMNNTGTANHIEANPIEVSDNIFTVSFWVNAQKSTNQVFVADPKIVIGTLNSLLYVVTTNSAPFTTTNFITGWNHIVVIRNGTTYKAYINGIAETRSGSNNYCAHSASKLWLLNRSYNTTYAANTSISDFRIYATVLSDEDIKELYNTLAFICNNNSLISYLFAEDSDTEILKNGIVKSDNFNEDNVVTEFYSDNIKTSQLIEI